MTMLAVSAVEVVAVLLGLGIMVASWIYNASQEDSSEGGGEKKDLNTRLAEEMAKIRKQQQERARKRRESGGEGRAEADSDDAAPPTTVAEAMEEISERIQPAPVPPSSPAPPTSASQRSGGRSGSGTSGPSLEEMQAKQRKLAAETERQRKRAASARR
ncbi:MAG: hypothetical protein R3336_01505, partial [Phycisphaeraceae bacterium]|nr:hypothetical protein [Phycisphaeraceae bacterium]